MTMSIDPLQLGVPASFAGRLGSTREELIHGHRFTRQSVAVDKMQRVVQNGSLGGFVDCDAPADADGNQWISRGGVFKVAQPIQAGMASDDEILTLLWHVLAWGTDNSNRRNKQRAANFSRANPELRSASITSLRRAVGHATNGEPRDAYAQLRRPGGQWINKLGASYLTKLLYFAGAGNINHGCLILDARVATSLHDAGWTAVPRRWSNWSSDVYVTYCELARIWAAQLSEKVGRPVGADEVERLLFEGLSAGDASS